MHLAPNGIGTYGADQLAHALEINTTVIALSLEGEGSDGRNCEFDGADCEHDEQATTLARPERGTSCGR